VLVGARVGGADQEVICRDQRANGQAGPQDRSGLEGRRRPGQSADQADRDNRHACTLRTVETAEPRLASRLDAAADLRDVIIAPGQAEGDALRDGDVRHLEAHSLGGAVVDRLAIGRLVGEQGVVSPWSTRSTVSEAGSGRGGEATQEHLSELCPDSRQQC
jgi:hypothetical protein